MLYFLKNVKKEKKKKKKVNDELIKIWIGICLFFINLFDSR